MATDVKWKVQLLKPQRVPYGMKGQERTVEPGIYEMRQYMRGYRLKADGQGFFDRTRPQVDALVAAGDLRITEGDWPP